MSEQHRTKEEYTELFVRDHTGGNTEVAAEYKIVKEVCETLEEE